jgi:hypothetical protein
MNKPYGRQRKISLVINGGIGINTTAGKIRDGLGRMADFNKAAQAALAGLEAIESGGLAEQFDGFNIHIGTGW